MSAKTRVQLEARLRVVLDALCTASDRYFTIPRTTLHRAERVEWGLIRGACRRELQRLKGQITKARRREELPA